MQHLPLKPIFLRIFFISLAFPAFFHAVAQKGNAPGGPIQARIYGKVQDAKGISVEFAGIRVFKETKDSLGNLKSELVSGGLTAGNGDFSAEKIPAPGNFKVLVSALGFFEDTIAVVFTQGRNSAMEKDLGNIKLKTQINLIGAAVVEGEIQAEQFDIDKKVYNVEKNPLNTGGTATDVLKNISSVEVDIDGKVTVRNSSPQIFVDGRPTLMELDQIPADAIEKIEVMTNPSAKFDASGGGGGIINVVLKKSKKIGYFGNLRAGTDLFWKPNFGGDFNIRESKLNFFLSGNYMGRKSISNALTFRDNFYQVPETRFSQLGFTDFNGAFSSVRAGFDYFMDNRNTLTAAGNFGFGGMDSKDEQEVSTDSIFTEYLTRSGYEKTTETGRDFFSREGSLLFKHIYPREGREFTSDLNFQKRSSDSWGEFITRYLDPSNLNTIETIDQRQEGGGANTQMVFQADYVDPFKEKFKLEAGVRTSLRQFESHQTNTQFIDSLQDYVERPALASNYEYEESIYAGYFSLSHKPGKFSYKAGLRAESSNYTGKVPDSNLVFRLPYPISLFPSGNMLYSFNQKSDVQVGYSRRISRPNFFQLMPYIDYTDSLNLKAGNPGLKPEFTHTLELNFRQEFGKGQTMLATGFFKKTENIVTSYQKFLFSDVLGKEVLVSSYENANSSYHYGGELTIRNTILKMITISTSCNASYSYIDGSNLENGLTNKRFTWQVRENINVRLNKRFSVQISADYRSKAAIPGGGGGGMGRGRWETETATVQGFVFPRFGIDGGIRFEFLKNNAASFSANISDAFGTRNHRSSSTSPYFNQDSNRLQNPHYVRVSLSYKFGKFDSSLFKRKHNRMESDEGGF